MGELKVSGRSCDDGSLVSAGLIGVNQIAQIVFTGIFDSLLQTQSSHIQGSRLKTHIEIAIPHYYIQYCYVQYSFMQG